MVMFQWKTCGRLDLTHGPVVGKPWSKGFFRENEGHHGYSWDHEKSAYMQNNSVWISYIRGF